MHNQQSLTADTRSDFQKIADISGSSTLTGILRRLARQAPLRTAIRDYQPVDGLDAYTFADTEEGSGAFGRWGLDAAELPAYRYDMNQKRDIRAFYINSMGLDRRDHWHQLGNSRITGLASNDGVVQLYSADRGGVFANRFDAYEVAPPTTLIGYIDAFLRWIVLLFGHLSAAWYRLRGGSKISPRGSAPQSGEAETTPGQRGSRSTAGYAGGFGYICDGDSAWATAFRYAPENAETTRTFGIGYVESISTYRDIVQKRRVYAPIGTDTSGSVDTTSGTEASRTANHDASNDPLLLSEVEIVNQRNTAVDLHFYEYWDINVHQLQVQWLRTGLFGFNGDLQRSAINQRFEPSLEWLPAHQALRFRQERNPDALVIDEIEGKADPTPDDIFLAALGTSPTAWYVDREAFFGSGTVYRPETVSRTLPGHTLPPKHQNVPMPYCLVFRYDVHLEPSQKISLHFAYGTAKRGETLDWLKRYRRDGWLQQSLDAWGNQLSYFTAPKQAILQRETSWHTYKLLASVVYSEYYRTHYVPQGSAYLYLHGADGAPRDQALFALPLVYIRPRLARDILRMLFQMQNAATLALPYAFVGHGYQDNARGLHANPSDLDLYLLLAAGEYLAATGDFDFLSETLPFYPPDAEVTRVPGLTVLDHLLAAFRHLVEDVGIGESGLLKIGDGDWDDGIVIQSALTRLLEIDRANSIQHGESVPNSQMALHVLPLVARLLEPYAPQLAAEMCTFSASLRDAVAGQWNGNWFNRAVLRGHSNESYTVGKNHINLQAQPWALISGLAREMGIEQTLLESITTLLDDPSPTGAMLEVKGAVWPAVSQLLTWGYMRVRPDLACRSLNRHTFAAHATVFPNVWFNIWSGPDGTNSKDCPNPGGTWSSPVTPMTDFPAMNANQHAMFLLGLLRTCGIEPYADGLRISPKTPLDRYILDTELLLLDVSSNHIRGEYRAIAANSRSVLYVEIPAEAALILVKLDDAEVTVPERDGTLVRLPLRAQTDQTRTFEVSWQNIAKN